MLNREETKCIKNLIIYAIVTIIFMLTLDYLSKTGVVKVWFAFILIIIAFLLDSILFFIQIYKTEKRLKDIKKK